MPYGRTLTYIIRNRRSTKVAKIMVVFYHKVNFASLCVCMGQMFRISNDFSSGASGPILLNFHMEPPLVWGMKDCWNGRGLLTKMAAMPIYGKNL